MKLPLFRLLLVLAAAPALPAAEDGATLLARARELAGQGKFAEALPVFTRLTEVEPENFRGHSGRGSMLNYLHRYSEGLASIQRAVELAPDNPLLYYNRGLSLAEVGRFPEALADFDRVIAARPELPMPHADRASVLASLGRLDEAAAGCEAAIKADANYIWSRYYRGGVHYLRGDFVSAAADFAAVAQNQPGFPAARLWRVLSERRAGGAVEAAQLQIVEADWPAPVLRYFAGELDDAALLRAAREQRVVDDDRRESAAHAYIGLRHLFAGDRAAARAAFTRALAYPVPRHFEQSVAARELERL